VKTIKVKAVFEAILRLEGKDPATSGITTTQRDVIADMVNDRFREGWQHYFWPEGLTVEQREYRQTYDASLSYVVGDEVYYSSHYYKCIANCSGVTPGTDATKWSNVDATFIRSIDFRQTGETEIDGIDVKDGIFDCDPRINRKAGRIENCFLEGETVIVGADQAPTQPWIRFRTVPRKFSWTDWNSGTDYAIEDVVYYATTGHSYKALRSSTNKNPESETSDWEPVEFPEFLFTFVKWAVAADRDSDDKAKAQSMDRAYSDLDRLVDKLEQQGEQRVATYGRK